MKIITTTYDGHVNSIGFKSWEEARQYVFSRIPKGSMTPSDMDEYWTHLEYLEKRDKGGYKKHIWDLNEVEVKSQRSS